MISSSLLCFARSASRRLFSKADGGGSGEDGAETVEPGTGVEAASGEEGTTWDLGDDGFDRSKTFASGLPLPDPLASP
jgi:hypothetical protein